MLRNGLDERFPIEGVNLVECDNGKCKRRRETRPGSAARAAHPGGVKVDRRKISMKHAEAGCFVGYRRDVQRGDLWASAPSGLCGGMSERQVAREFGLARETVRKMLQYAVPPGYRRQQPAKRPKLDAWVGVIDQILEEDRSRPRKQRHTAKRIHERLRAEHGFSGGYTIVKDYVRLRKVNQREMFVPLVHPPGDAQAGCGEALVVIGGAERKAHYLAIDLPQSDDCFVMAFPAETTEAFVEGHNQAFAYFGECPAAFFTTTRSLR